MKYSVKKGKIASKNGIPHSPRWLADGRLAFAYDEKGIRRLEYFAPRKPRGNHIMFSRGTFDSFRAFIEKDGLTYSPEYQNLEILPYRISADWVVGGWRFRFCVAAISESLVFSVTCPKALPEGFTFKLPIYHR